MTKWICSFLILFVFCRNSIAGDLTLYFLSRGLDKNDGKHYATIQSLNINDALHGNEETSTAKIIQHWKNGIAAESIIHSDPTCRYFPNQSFLYYIYVEDSEQNDKRSVKIFNLEDPSSPSSVPKEYYKDGGRFNLPQFNFETYPDKFFVLFMNRDKFRETLTREEFWKDPQRARLQKPSLKCYHIGTVEEKIEPDLNIVASMGEDLSVFLTPKGQINYLGYGLIHDGLQLPYTIPDDVLLKLDVTDQPDDNIWIILRNRQNHLVLAGQGKTLLYLKETDQWKLYITPVKYKLTESNGYLIFNFIGTYGQNQFGDSLRIYKRGKLCVNLSEGESCFLHTAIDSRIIYFDGEMKVVLSENGLEVSKGDELLKFIYYPQAKYIDEVMFRATN